MTTRFGTVILQFNILLYRTAYVTLTPLAIHKLKCNPKIFNRINHFKKKDINRTPHNKKTKKCCKSKNLFLSSINYARHLHQ